MKSLREITDEFFENDKKYDAGGGVAKIQKQHEKGRLFVRERINKLLDKDSFVEIDRYVEHHCSNFGMEKKKGPGDGIVTGYGTINGRTVFVYADDFTTFGGTVGEMHSKKVCKVLDLALENRKPVIGIHDSGGGRIQEGVDAKHGYGEIFTVIPLCLALFRNYRLLWGPVPEVLYMDRL